MIQIIRPKPAHIDQWLVDHYATMSPELVRAHLHGAQVDRRDSLQREDRDRFDRSIEAAQFVLSELEPVETRIARERYAIERVEHQLAQHRELVARLEADLRAHAKAVIELSVLAARAEVAA